MLNIAMEHGRTDILDLLLSEGAGASLLFLKGIAWNVSDPTPKDGGFQ